MAICNRLLDANYVIVESNMEFFYLFEYYDLIYGAKIISNTLNRDKQYNY